MQKLYFIAFLLTIAHIRAILGENLHSKNKTKENVVMKKLYKIFLIGAMSLMLVACGNDDANAAKTVEEETRVEETVEKPVTEENVTEEPATEESTVVEEKNMTEYQLTQMDTGFYGGIAWATVSSDAGTKHVLINKELQAVYELPEGMKAGDIFDGRAVVVYSDQSANPGFIILGTDGTALYECADNLGGTSDTNYTGHSYNVNFTRDGSTIYEKNESGLTGNKVTACVLNDTFDTIAEIEITGGFLENEYGSTWVTMPRHYVYLSDGVYGSYSEYGAGVVNEAYSLLNVKGQTTAELMNQGHSVRIDQDMDRCAGLRVLDGNYESWAAVNGDAIEYSGVTDCKTLTDLVKTNGKTYTESDLGTHAYFDHGYIMYTESSLDYGTGIDSIEGFVLPDFGAPIEGFRLSNDGKYASLEFRGADSNFYGTVISSEGQKMYEPVITGQLGSQCCVCDGYIFTDKGIGFTPDGNEFQMGDGTALSGIGENSTAYVRRAGDENRVGEFLLSDGYIVSQRKLYRLDGTEVTTVTAVN